MAYIGNQPTSVAFVTDQFSGNGSTTAFTMSVAPANTASVLIAISGVLQDPSTYSVSGTTLTFSAAPPTGTGNISARYLGIPASGVTTTAYRTVTEFTATAGQTTFSVTYTVGFVEVYQNGTFLKLGTDYTATNGTSVVLATGATLNDVIETIAYYTVNVAPTGPTGPTGNTGPTGPTGNAGPTGSLTYDTFTATASQTTFTTSASYTSGKIMVFAQGVKMRNGTDVTVTSGTQIVFATGLPVGTLVDAVY